MSKFRQDGVFFSGTTVSSTNKTKAARYGWNIAERGAKHHNINPNPRYSMDRIQW
jgi:hypothetical protein